MTVDIGTQIEVLQKLERVAAEGATVNAIPDYRQLGAEALLLTTDKITDLGPERLLVEFIALDCPLHITAFAGSALIAVRKSVKMYTAARLSQTDGSYYHDTTTWTLRKPGIIPTGLQLGEQPQIHWPDEQGLNTTKFNRLVEIRYI
jgi:hypothetical protein